MTLYWWSHWFWITLLSNFIFHYVVVVNTYPSQESTLDYNNHQQENSKKLVTRLHQATTPTWTTDAPTYYVKSTTVNNLKLRHVEQSSEKAFTKDPQKNDEKEPSPSHNNKEEEEEYYYNYDATEDKDQELNLEEMEIDLEKKELVSESKGKGYDIEVKRSAESIQNKTALNRKDEAIKKVIDNSTTSAVVETNNYTNFTDKHNLTSTNATATNSELNESSANATITTNTSDNSVTNATAPISITNFTTQLPPQVALTPKITKAPAGNLDWLKSIRDQQSTSHLTTDVAQEEKGESHKIPFTLENVNKPEDLRHDEGEHRTRKSKGLSAEYKVNHYINYSSDSKNLLTRSAATTVNEYDSEESNISSEALSVQRAYFMDVGSISAICVTVFGICCTVGTVGIVLYRRRFLNKPQALSEPDSSVYIDDSTMRVSVSTDNSDEMYSLDNDSFLNSLEAMTIQNYWTDTVKHTKL